MGGAQSALSSRGRRCCHRGEEGGRNVDRVYGPNLPQGGHQ